MSERHLDAILSPRREAHRLDMAERAMQDTNAPSTARHHLTKSR